MQGGEERGSKLGLSPWSGGERGCVWIRLVLGCGWDQHRHSPAAQEHCNQFYILGCSPKQHGIDWTWENGK